MKARVIVNGARGKMGTLACRTLKEHDDFELVAELGRGDDLEQAIQDKKATIVVDLTTAESVYQTTLTIIRQGAHPVIGTSGLLENQIETLTRISEEQALGGIIVPNFSIGAVLMMHFASIAARFIPESEIIEAHHQQKLDAPSGTAIKTAALIQKARTNEKNRLNLRELIPGARGASVQDTPVHSVRLPGILARQQVIFGHLGETLTLEHNSIDRTSFMPGIILACKGVQQLQLLYYGLEHLLDLN